MTKPRHFAPFGSEFSPCRIRVSRPLGSEQPIAYCALEWEKVTCVHCLRWNPDATHILGPKNAHGDRPACHPGMSDRKFVDEKPTCPKCAQIEHSHAMADKLPSTPTWWTK